MSDYKIKSGAWAIMVRSLVQIVRRPLMWVAMIGLPVFLILFVTSMLETGLPTKIPAAIVEKKAAKAVDIPRPMGYTERTSSR